MNRESAARRAGRPSTTEDAKALVRRWFGEAMNSGSASRARAASEEVFAEDFIDHDGTGSGGTRDRADWQGAVLDSVFAGFSCIDVRIQHLLAEDDLVAVRYVFSGTHTGAFQGRAPTGRRIRHTENEIFRIADGRITESWCEGDWLGTFRQLDSPVAADGASGS